LRDIRKTAIGEHRKNLLRKLRWSDSFEQETIWFRLWNNPGWLFEKIRNARRCFKRFEKLAAPLQREALHLVFLSGPELERSGDRDGHLDRKALASITNAAKAGARILRTDGK